MKKTLVCFLLVILCLGPSLIFAQNALVNTETDSTDMPINQEINDEGYGNDEEYYNSEEEEDDADNDALDNAEALEKNNTNVSLGVEGSKAP